MVLTFQLFLLYLQKDWLQICVQNIFTNIYISHFTYKIMNNSEHNFDSNNDKFEPKLAQNQKQLLNVDNFSHIKQLPNSLQQITELKSQGSKIFEVQLADVADEEIKQTNQNNCDKINQNNDNSDDKNEEDDEDDNLRSTTYGCKQAEAGKQQNEDYKYIYNDDEKLIEKAKEESKDVKLQLQLKAQRSLIKLKTKTDLPVMATLKSSGGSRTSVDLICVIDNSGSMQGEKIELVKSTIRFLLETLTPSDRLSIITFNGNASRLCGLKCVTGENIPSLLAIIKNINTNKGTNINSGLKLALKVMRERNQVNQVTSIFLLSDGQDKDAERRFKRSLVEPRNKQLGPFSLNSFGFGFDHDEQLMLKLCQIKGGAFYFIKELATLDQAFCNALGAIISLVANSVIIKISNVAKNIVEGVRIGKVYGQMWQKLSEKECKIKITQLASDITKDFVFELEIPAIDGEVGDINRDHKIIQAIFYAKDIFDRPITGKCNLKLTLLNENQKIMDGVQNVDVIQNYFRVKAAVIIKESIKMADKQHYAEACKGIENMIKVIQENKKVRKQNMQNLVNDLMKIKQKCSKNEYISEGRKWMLTSQYTHEVQNNFQYQNKTQLALRVWLHHRKR